MSTGPLSTCCLMARNNIKSGSPAHSCTKTHTYTCTGGEQRQTSKWIWQSWHWTAGIKTTMLHPTERRWQMKNRRGQWLGVSGSTFLQCCNIFRSLTLPTGSICSLSAASCSYCIIVVRHLALSLLWSSRSDGLELTNRQSSRFRQVPLTVSVVIQNLFFSVYY